MLRFIEQKWGWLTLLVLALITTFSLLPLPQLPDVPGSDKTHHLTAYAMLIFPVALANHKTLPLMVLFFIAWSGAIELIQPFVNRYGEWLDLLANTAGILLGLLLGLLVRILFLGKVN